MPTTKKELRQIEKRARARDAERSTERAKKATEGMRGKYPAGWRNIREYLLQNRKVKVFRPQFFDLLIEYIKDNGEKPPAYNLWETKQDADASFRYDMQCCVARMSWMQCAKLVHVGVGVPIPTRDQSEAWHCLMQVLFSAFDIVEDVEDENGKQHWVTIKNRDALDEWPIMPRKRKSNKEDDKMFADENNRKLRASAGDDEDEDDEAPKKGRGGDDEDEDEDEKPKRKAKATKRKAKDEDEDDEPPRRKKKVVDEDEDEDEKPTRKRRASKDDEDEDDEKPAKRRRAAKDDDEDEEDDKPVRKRRAAKDDEDDEDEKPEKVVIKDNTIVAKIKERDKGGPKSKVLALIPKKGISIKELTIDAKEEGIASSKIKEFITFLLKYEYIKVK